MLRILLQYLLPLVLPLLVYLAYARLAGKRGGLSDTPWLVVFWIPPPVQVAADVQVPPLPVIVRPAVAPVLFSEIPFVTPSPEMLLNVNPLAPMLMLLTFSAVPDVGGVVAPIVLVPVIVNVPPRLELVAVNVVPVPFSVSPPEKLNVDVPLFCKRMPVPPVSVMAAVNVTVPLVRP